MDLGIVRRIEGDNYTVIAAGGPQRSGSMRLVAMVPSVVTLGGFSYSFVQHRVTSLPLVAPNPQLICQFLDHALKLGTGGVQEKGWDCMCGVTPRSVPVVQPAVNSDTR